jgi:hypothetical protein
MPNATRVFRSLGVLEANTSVSRARALAPVAAPTTSSTQAIRAAAASTTLSVAFDSGFTERQKDVLYRNRAQLIPARFGLPSPEQRGKTVTVRSDSSTFDSAYIPLRVPSATSAGTIYFRYSTTESEQVNAFNFTRLLLLAYQGPNTFSYDYLKGNYIESWQVGFADAAALLIAYSAEGSKPTFDPSLISEYVLPVYDLFNHPELANAYVYSRSNADMVISDFRAAMAQAAWLKVAVENPNFFVQFNAAYYAAVEPRKAVTPQQLRSIAAGVVPTVEGLSFNDWIRRQYALDTTVSTGQKLYTAILPLPIIDGNDTRAGFQGYAEAFTTTSTGDETPSVGYGSVNAFDEKGNNINAFSDELRQSSLLDFTKNKGDAPGQAIYGGGFRGLGTPDSARITLKLRFLTAETSAVFPYISQTGVSNISYYGVTSYGDSGTVALSPNNGSADNATVQRGAWLGSKKYVSATQVKTILKLGSKTFVRNTAWLAPGENALGVGFVLDGSASSSSFTLKTAAGASKLRMISLPFYPLESDESKILGIAATDLKLARYRPNLSAGTLANGILTFGINGDRHEIYPYISTPMGPGRGYWLSADGALQRSIAGTEPSRTQVFEAPVLGGWNQIGVPFNRAFGVDKIKVRYGGFAAVSYATAIANGWIQPGIWKWQPAGGYARVDSAATASLQPYEGYYIYAVPQRGVSIVFDSATSSEPQAMVAGWTVPLQAATATVRDASNRFGVSTTKAAAKPPAALQVVTLRFLSSGSGDSDNSGAGAASGWADSFLPDFNREGVWKFLVEGTSAKERVTLSWGDLKGVPADMKLTLEDSKLASQLRLTKGGSYKWNSDGAARAFQVRATRIAIPVLSLKEAPSDSLTVAVTLNIAAKGRLEIQNSAGDTVIVLKNGSFAAAKAQFNWTGRQTNGQIAPAGRYVAVWTPEDKNDKTAMRSFTKK